MSHYIKKKIQKASETISTQDKKMQKEAAKKKLRSATRMASLGVRG